jgi:hypothetical protein
VHRTVSGQVFVISDAGETLKFAGVSIRIFDADYLAEARQLFVQYSHQNFDTANAAYAGSLGRIMRAKLRVRERLDDAWDSLARPIATVITDADGRFEFSGALPNKIGLLCVAGKSQFGTHDPYRWALVEEEFGEPRRIVLSNHNRLK